MSAGSSAGSAPDTVSAALRRAALRLAGAGVPSADHDARELMAAALTAEQVAGQIQGPSVLPASSGMVTAMDLVLRGADPAPASFLDLVERRAAREPLQFILGRAPVVGVDLSVGPGVFIPRPETDLLIDWAAGEIQRWDQWRRRSPLYEALIPPRFTIVDLCSGPGTISLGLGHLLTRAGLSDRVALRIVGIEIDSVAVDHAERNLADWRERGEIDQRITVEFHQGDATDQTLITSLGLVAAADLVVSNPPYVPEGEDAEEVALAEPEVVADPYHAVYSGADGLELMGPLARSIALICAQHAIVGVEHDDTTGVEVRGLLAEAGVSDLEQHQDFADRDRFVIGKVRRDPGFRPPETVTQRLQ